MCIKNQKTHICGPSNIEGSANFSQFHKYISENMPVSKLLDIDRALKAGK